MYNTSFDVKTLTETFLKENCAWKYELDITRRYKMFQTSMYYFAVLFRFRIPRNNFVIPTSILVYSLCTLTDSLDLFMDVRVG